MTHEKVIDKGSLGLVKIIVWIFQDNMRAPHKYSVEVQKKSPYKRKWQNVIDTDNYLYRRIPFKDRDYFEYSEMLKYVTEEEIKQAKLELWEKLKP